MKNKSHISLCLVALLTMVVFIGTTAIAANITSTAAGGDWNVPATWVGGVVPVAGDNVTIAINADVTVTADAACATLTWAAGVVTANHALAVNAGFTLAVSGAVTYVSPAAAFNRTINVLGTFTCASLAMPNTGANGQDCVLAVGTSGIVTVSGNITMAGVFARNHIDITGAGTINIGGNVDNGAGAVGGGFTTPPATSMINLNGSSAQTVFLYGGISALGILKINNTAGVTSGSAMTVTTLTIGDVTPNSVFNDGGFVITPGAGSVLNLTNGTYNLGSATVATAWPAWGTRNITAGTTVGYISNVAQTASATPAYQNLTLGGAAAKTITGLTSVAGNFTLSGTATVTLPNGFSIGGNLAIIGGTLTLANGTAITVSGDVSGGGTLTTGGGTRTINVAGDWTFSGTSTGSGLVANFNGTGDQTLQGVVTTGAGGTGSVIINKASGQVLLGGNVTINNAGLTVPQGTFNPNANLLTVTTLTPGATGTILVDAATWAGNYTATTITAPAAGNTIQYTNANPIINAAITYQNLAFSGSGTAGASAALTVQGNLSNSGGGILDFGANNVTFSGTVVAENIDGFTTTGTVTMTKTAGVATCTGNLNSGALTLNGAGGTLNLGTAFTHSVPSITFANGTLNLGSSTLNVAGAVTLTTGILNLGSGTLNLTGNFSGAGTLTGGTGTMNFNGTTAQTAVGKATYNIVKINNAAGVTLTSAATIPTLTIGDENANSVFNDGGFQVTSTGTLNLTSGTFNLGSATVATTWPAFTTRNISTGTTVGYVSGLAGGQTVSAVPSYQNLTFSGNAPKNIAAGGTLSIGSVWSLAGGLTTLQTTANATVAGDITGTGAITMGTGTLSIGGNWTNNGAFTQGTGTVNYNGNYVGQIVRGGLTYNNLQISNGGTKTLQVGNTTVSNVLTLNSGVFKLNDFNLILNNNTTNAIAGTYSNSSLIQTNGTGYVQKAGAAFNAGGGIGFNIVYPIGAGGFYNPLDLTGGFTATSGTGNLQIRAITADQGANALSKYWILTVTAYGGITTNLRFTYNNLEVQGIKSTYDTWYSNGTWVSAPGTHTALGANPFGTNVAAATAASISGSWSAGTTAPDAASASSFFSYQSGDWADATSWTSDASGTLWINPGVPGSIDNATILNGRTISINTNGKQVSTLTLNSGGILDIKSTTGHNFGTVTGQGKIMLSSNTFPGGTSYAGFVAGGGGTIEYYNLNNISLSTSQLMYNNLIVSNYTNNANSAFLINNANPTTYVINGNFNLKNYSSGSQAFYFGNPTASNNLIDMTVYGNFSVDAGCQVRVNNFAGVHNIPNANDFGATPYPVHTLLMYGNFTNNGSVRFTGLASPVDPAYYALTTTASPLGGTNYGDVQVFFKGSTNNTVACNGTTDFFRLIVEKGTDKTYTLEINSSNTNNFALYAPNNQGNNNFNEGGAPPYAPDRGYGYGAYYKALFIHYGTLKLNENITIPSLTQGGQDFNLIPTAGLWINGADVSTATPGAVSYTAATLYGSLRISAGQFSTENSAGIVLGLLGTPEIIIEGTGTLDVSQVSVSGTAQNKLSYIQRGGTANFRLNGPNRGNAILDLSNTNTVFTMSGGALNFTSNTNNDASTKNQILDIQAQVGNYNVTGGTVNLNLPGFGTSYTANSTVPFYNLNISRNGITGTTTVQWNNTSGSSLSVLNDLTIGDNCILDLNTNLKNLSVGHDFTMTSGGTYSPATGATNITTFNGSGSQAFNNIGTITGGLLTNFTITNSSTTTIVNDVTVSGTITIDQNATLNDGGKFIRARGNIVMSGTHTGQPAGGIYLENNAAQIISGAGTGIFNNLILNKTAGSVTVGANISITGALKLAGGTAGVWNILNIGNYNLSLGANAAVYSDLTTGTSFNNNRMIQTSGALSSGGVSKTFSNTTAFVFPFGFGTYYQPASIQFSNATGITYGTVSIKPVNARHSLAQGTNNALTCFWKTSSTGFSGIPPGSVVHSYTYNPVLVQGAEVSYVARYYNSSSWINDANLTVNSGTHIISYSAANSADGEFTAGLPAAFGTIPTLYSVANGNWNNPNSWSTTRGGTAGDGGAPTLTSPVVVTSGTIVTTAAAGTSSSRLTVEAGATLDLQNYQDHNFGTIVNDGTTGCGTIRIASTGYFPAGDWAYFLGTAGGTVEYYQTTTATTFTLPATITSYYNLITSPYNASNIILPNTNLTVYNNFTVGYSTGGGTTGCITQINPGAASTTLEVKGNININQYGVLQYMNNLAENVIADNDINIASGGALQVRNGGNTVANTLTVYGNIANNGIFDLDPNNGINYCNLIFTGSLNKTLSNTTTPTRTHLYSITVNKGTSLNPVINVNIDNTGFQMGGGGLNLQNGTFRLTTNTTISLPTGSFTIPSTACLSANGGNFNIATGTASADLILNGRLEIFGGTVTVGPDLTSTSNPFSIVYAMAGAPEIIVSGGSLNVYSQIRRGTGSTSGSLSYTQIGGTVSIGGKNSTNTSRAVFEVLNDGIFSMSNGTLIIGNHINNTSPFDLYLDPGIENVTGGTIQFGLSTAVTTSNIFNFQTTCTIGNIALEAATNSSAVQQVLELNLAGNLIIGGATSYYDANGLDVIIGGNLTNNNTGASTGINVGGFRAHSDAQTTSFIGNVNQTITGTTSNFTNFANLEAASTAGHTLNLDDTKSSNIIVNDDLTLTSGTLNDGGNTVTLLNNVDNNAVHNSPNPTSGGMIFKGTVTQQITGNGSGVFANIEINNGGHGVDVTDNSTINGQLKFTNGYLNIYNFALTLGQSSVIAGTTDVTKMIKLDGVVTDGGVTKIFPSGISSFTFPIGTNGTPEKYTPSTFDFSSNPNPAGATIKVIPVDDLHPTINPATTNHLNYYWYVTTTGLSSAYTVTQTYTYLPADVDGVTPNIERYNNAAWTSVPLPPGTIGASTFSTGSVTFLNGSYTIGDPVAPLPTLYSTGTGSWFTAATWSPANVPNGNPVVIQPGHIVSLDANSAVSASVVVNGVLDAQNTTSHNIGQVSGGGTIRLLSTGDGMFAFPGGSYDDFLVNPASIVEYYGNSNGTMPLTPGDINKPYQNVLISGTGIKYVSAVNIKINGNLTISSGSKLNNSLYNKDIFILGNWIDDNTIIGGFTAGTGTVHFSGTAAQSITMANDAMKEPFYSLDINNVAGFTISTGNVDIDNQLLLTSGNLNTSSTHNLTINNTGTNAVVGGSVNSFVNGPLRKKINNGSSFQFPVGDAVTSARNRFGYVSVNSTSTSATQIWTAQFFDKNPTTDGYNVLNMEPPLQSVISNEYWNIIGPTGGSANVVLSWDQYTGMNSSAAIRSSDTKVVEWNLPVSSKWNSVGEVVTDNGQNSGTVATSTTLSLENHFFTIGAMSSSILITSAQSGNWSSTSTWAGGITPRITDKVHIGTGMTVTMNSNPTVAGLTVDGTLNDDGNSHTLTLNGDLILNGTWNSIGTNLISMATVNGTISGAGSMTGTSTLEIALNTIVAADASPTLTNVSILSGKTLTNYGTVTINSLSSGGTFENKSGSTLLFTGANMDAVTLAAGECTNTVIYSGTDQAVKPAMHCNIILRGGGTKTISNGIQSHGDVIQETTVPVTNVIVNSDVVWQIDGGLVVGAGFVNYGDITLGN